MKLIEVLKSFFRTGTAGESKSLPEPIYVNNFTTNAGGSGGHEVLASGSGGGGGEDCIFWGGGAGSG